MKEFILSYTFFFHIAQHYRCEVNKTDTFFMYELVEFIPKSSRSPFGIILQRPERPVLVEICMPNALPETNSVFYPGR